MPIGSYILGGERKHQGGYGNNLHAISFVRKRLDDQFLVNIAPPFVVGNKIDLEPDIASDIRLVTILVVKGNAERRQRFKTGTNVSLWLACETYMEIFQAERNKLLNKSENLRSGRSRARGIGTFINGIHDNVHRVLG